MARGTIKSKNSKKYAQYLEPVKEKASNVKNSTKKFVSKNPISSIAIAAGIGALISYGAIKLFEKKEENLLEKVKKRVRYFS